LAARCLVRVPIYSCRRIPATNGGLTGWQPHTVRGAFAGALKKKLGLIVTSEKIGDQRIYRISGEPAAQEAGL
jgi:hypothetical protein